VIVRPKTQLATTWLCLVVAMLIALLPSAGLVVCLGHDGHVGIGSTTEVGACPCEHSSSQHEEQDDLGDPRLPVNTDQHPLCDDVALEAPKVFGDGKHSKKLLKGADLLDDWTPAPLCLAPDRYSFDATRSNSKRGRVAPGAVGPLLRQQLEHKRVVVLLI